MTASREHVAWRVQGLDPRMASLRYRCLMPLFGLQGRGMSSVVLADGEALRDPGRIAAVVLVKPATTRDVAFAARAAAAGVPVVIDLCDNIFVEAYGGAQHDRIAGAVGQLLDLAAAVVVTGPALARRVRDRGRAARVIDIPDAEETPELARRCLDVLAWRFDPERLRRTEVRRAFARWRAGRALSPPPPSAAPVALPPRTAAARLVWFGNHGSAHGRYGIETLLDLAPALAELARTHSVELLVVSDNREKFLEVARSLPLPTLYRDWDPLAIFDCVRSGDVCLVPNSRDEFSICKSANRVVLALSLGVPVVATDVPALAPLRDCVMRDDWCAGIATYLADRATADRHLAAARAVIRERYAVTAIGAAWADVLASLPARRGR